MGGGGGGGGGEWCGVWWGRMKGAGYVQCNLIVTMTITDPNPNCDLNPDLNHKP